MGPGRVVGEEGGTEEREMEERFLWGGEDEGAWRGVSVNFES